MLNRKIVRNEVFRIKCYICLKAFENTTQNMLNGHYYAVSKIKIRDGAAIAVLIKQPAALSGIKNVIKYFW